MKSRRSIPIRLAAKRSMVCLEYRAEYCPANEHDGSTRPWPRDPQKNRRGSAISSMEERDDD